MPASLFKYPSALLPILMSLSALAVVVIHIAMFGAAREPDEGTAAHLWQLLVAGQAPVVVYFAVRWIPHAAGPALRVLGLQVIAILAACAPVYYLHW